MKPETKQLLERMNTKQTMKKELLEKFREAYKDSSLFDSWDGCEKDLTKFISNVYDVAYNLGWKEKAEQIK